MKKRIFITLLIFAYVAVLSAFSTPAMAAKEKPVLLKVPVTFSTALPGLGHRGLSHRAAAYERQTHGSQFRG